MIGERIDISKANPSLLNYVYDWVEDRRKKNAKRIVVAISGESGAGKSVLAYALKALLNEHGVGAEVFQQDDYFWSPPKENHELRKQKNYEVGPKEVNMELLNQHVEAFHRGDDFIEKPFVNRERSGFFKKEVNLKNLQVMIVEGTYVFLLENLDGKIFLDETYLETKLHRMHRSRDVVDSPLGKILEIEHSIIKKHRELADLIIKKNPQTEQAV